MKGFKRILVTSLVASLILATTKGIIHTVQETKAKESFNAHNYAVENIYYQNEIKEFEAYEHMFKERYLISSHTTIEYELKYNIEIPEGYEIYEINKSTTDVNGKEYKYIDVWFINNCKVEVIPYLDSTTQEYKYDLVGFAVPTVEETTGQKLTK